MAMPRKRFIWLAVIAGGLWLWSKRTQPVVVLPAADTQTGSIAPTAASTTMNMQALALAGRAVR